MSGPREANATSVATPRASGEPIKGMNAAKNVSRARGKANGTCKISSATQTSTALVAAMITTPRV